MEDLHKKGLIRIEPDIALTEQGMNFLKEYRKVSEFLEKFGLVRVRNE